MTNLLFLFLFFFITIGSAVYLPFGILTWTWIAIQSPQQMIQEEFAANTIIVVATLFSLLLNKRKIQPNIDYMIWILVLLLFHTFITTQTSVLPVASDPIFSRFWKMVLLVVFISLFFDNRTRVHALAWVIFLSLGTVAVKGAVFAIASGGAARVYGPKNSPIQDNNHFGIAVTMAIPFCIYLIQETRSKAIRTALLVAAVLMPLAVIFTYSRTALLALVGLAGCYWTMSNRKVTFAAVAVVGLVVAFPYMPEAWTGRMATIGATTGGYEEVDESVQGRFNSWEAHWTMAMRRPLIGGGFRTIERMVVWQTLHPALHAHAAHNSYIQVLGEHGFPGFILFVLLLIAALLRCFLLRRKLFYRPEFKWGANLATACLFSLVVYSIGSMGLSLAYHEYYYVVVGTVICLAGLVKRTGDGRMRNE